MTIGSVFLVGLRLDGRPVLVVGGGAVALRKTEELLAADAEVTVVAPEVDERFDDLEVDLRRRRYEEGEASGYWFVVTATDDPAVNRQVFRDGEAASVFVNAADDPTNCSAVLPARVRRGDITVAVSTNGRSPAFASWLRKRIGNELGPEYDATLELFASERDALITAGESTEGRSWQVALDSGILELVRSGRIGEAKELLRACL